MGLGGGDGCTSMCFLVLCLCFFAFFFCDFYRLVLFFFIVSPIDDDRRRRRQSFCNYLFYRAMDMPFYL